MLSTSPRKAIGPVLRPGVSADAGHVDDVLDACVMKRFGGFRRGVAYPRLVVRTIGRRRDPEDGFRSFESSRQQLFVVARADDNTRTLDREIAYLVRIASDDADGHFRIEQALGDPAPDIAVGCIDHDRHGSCFS